MSAKISLFPEGPKEAEPGPRRLGRELALRLLCQHEVTAGTSPAETMALFSRGFDPEEDAEQGLELSTKQFKAAWPFAESLFLGVCRHQAEIDQALGRAALNWQLSRLAMVDRNLLRLAYFEIIHLEDVPAKVSLNEAIELGKLYGAEDSAAFINGLLDRLLHESPPAK